MAAPKLPENGPFLWETHFGIHITFTENKNRPKPSNRLLVRENIESENKREN